jgi:MFS transporter, FSR family, fosmidomycin resistance protein
VNLKLILVLSVSHLFMDFTGPSLAVVLPLLKTALNLSYTEVGAAIMISNVTSSIIQPVFGYLSDRAEMKWLLPLSMVLAYLGFSLVGVAQSYLALILLVMLSGIGIACYHPEGFKIMHHLTGRGSATGMSFFQVGGALGMALGPLAMMYCLQIAQLRGTLLFLIVGFPVLAILLLYFRDFPHPRQAHRHLGKTPISPPVAQARRTWTTMALLIVAVALRSSTHLGLTTFIQFYYITVLHGDSVTAGKLVFTFLMGGAVGTLGGAVIADKIGHKHYFWLSMLSTVPLLFLLLAASQTWIFLILFVLGLVLISSFSVTVVMGQKILANQLGMASGLMLGFVLGIGGIGAGLLGMVADAWGIMAVMKIIALMPVLGSIIVFFMPYPYETIK